MRTFFVVVFGMAGGLAATFQARFLGVMQQRAGTLASTFVTYAGGGIVIGVLMLAFGSARFSDLRSLPWWVFTAGVMGLVVVASLGLTVDRLGLGAGLTLFTGATLVLAALFDHFGWLGDSYVLDLRRVTGVAMVIAGTWLVVAGR